MSQVTTALRAGWSRGLIELRQSFTGAALIGQLFWPAVTLVAIFFLRDKSFGARGFTLGAFVLPSVLGMFSAFGMLLMIQYLTAEREDGTLLRAKATPNGIRGYFIGKLVTVSGTILAYVTILLLPGLLIVHGLDIGSGRAWLTLAWVLLLGLVATQSIGAILGSLIASPRGAGYMSLPVMGLIRDLRHLLSDHGAAAVAAVDCPGLPDVLARPRHALGPAAGSRGQRRDRPFLAEPGNPRGAGGLGRARSGLCAARAAPDGAPGVRIERGRASRESAAAGRMRRSEWRAPRAFGRPSHAIPRRGRRGSDARSC